MASAAKIGFVSQDVPIMPFRLSGLLQPLTLAKSYAWAAAVLVDELDAGKLEGFADSSLNRLARYWPSRSFKIGDL